MSSLLRSAVHKVQIEILRRTAATLAKNAHLLHRLFDRDLGPTLPAKRTAELTDSQPAKRRSRRHPKDLVGRLVSEVIELQVGFSSDKLQEYTAWTIWAPHWWTY